MLSFTHVRSVIDIVTEYVQSILLIRTQSHRCVCHSLIARRILFLYLSVGQRSHTQSPHWSFLNVCNLRGSVATYLWCVGNIYTCFVGNFILFPAVKKIKIVYHLAKLLPKLNTTLFSETLCIREDGEGVMCGFSSGPNR